MTDWTAEVVAALDRQVGPPWAVIPGIFTPPEAACGEYPSAGAAHAALVTASFSPSAQSVAAPPLATRYDPQTVMRYSAGEGRDVPLVRRAPTTRA